MIYENIEKAKHAKDEAKRIDELKAKLYVEADSIDEFKLQCTMNGVNLNKLDPFLIYYYIRNSFQFANPINDFCIVALGVLASLSGMMTFIIILAASQDKHANFIFIILTMTVAAITSPTLIFYASIIVPRFNKAHGLVADYLDRQQHSSSTPLQQGYTHSMFTSISSLPC